ncbi:MAG TPA: hypothetical protein VJA21_20660, partial [Verrucomicrobiae bacterium]
FSCSDPGWFTAADVLTATATDPAGNTSELSVAATANVSRPFWLRISLSGNRVTVSWPSAAAAAGFLLESAPSPAPQAAWETISAGIGDDGTTASYVLGEVPAGGPRFFRLRK